MKNGTTLMTCSSFLFCGPTMRQPPVSWFTQYISGSALCLLSHLCMVYPNHSIPFIGLFRDQERLVSHMPSDVACLPSSLQLFKSHLLPSLHRFYRREVNSCLAPRASPHMPNTWGPIRLELRCQNSSVLSSIKRLTS